MEIEYSNKAVDTLVEDRPFFKSRSTVFVTISPNPKTKHPCWRVSPEGKRITCKCAYGHLPQKEQYAYCLKILRACYLPFLSLETKLVGTWELNGSGDVHLHILFRDPDLNNDTQLSIFRRDIANCTLVTMNKNKMKDKDYMNNIVFLNKPLEDVIVYMDKDYDMNCEIFKNYTVG